MKFRLIYIAIFMLTSINSFANGKVIESLEFKGRILNSPVKYSVYLPEDYETSQRSYPVIYLLHGSSDDETAWIQFGEVDQISDHGIMKGDFPPAIIIMPDAKLTWYCNDAEKKDEWRNMFIKEFIPSMEKMYRIKSKREFRAIAGLSMGGFGAVSLALSNPELFSTCVSLSGAFFSNEDIINMSPEDYSYRIARICGLGLKGESRITSSWKEVNPFDLIEKIPVEQANSIHFYFDCGDKDALLKGNYAMHVKMQNLKIQHEFRVRDGRHEWSYWRSGIVDGLKYIGNYFHR